jgi:hypothetical protein
MRRCYLPLAIAGLAGLGILFLTDRGHEILEWMTDNLYRAIDWNEAAQRELDRIQVALNRVADSLEAAR